jgi:hypothetical protein
MREMELIFVLSRTKAYRMNLHAREQTTSLNSVPDRGRWLEGVELKLS